MEALKVIEAEASRALAEMRTMVRVLRQPADLDPSPGVADLAELRQARGLPVEVEIRGDVGRSSRRPAPRSSGWPRSRSPTRRRHARHATRVRVLRLGVDDAISAGGVTDDGEATAPGAAQVMVCSAWPNGPPSSAAPATAGPNPGRGWTVTAVLPRTA